MSAKLDAIVNELKTLTLLEAADLVKQIEQAFGIDASWNSMAMAAPAAPVAAAASVEAVEEKASFEITLSEVPADKKIAVLQIVRTITGLGLKESKDIVDNAPKVIKEGVTKEESAKIKKELEDAGAKVVIK